MDIWICEYIIVLYCRPEIEIDNIDLLKIVGKNEFNEMCLCVSLLRP